MKDFDVKAQNANNGFETGFPEPLVTKDPLEASANPFADLGQGAQAMPQLSGLQGPKVGGQFDTELNALLLDGLNEPSPIESLVSQVLEEVPAFDAALQSSVGLLDRGSVLYDQTVETGTDFAKDLVETLGQSFREWRDAALESWNDPDNIAHNELNHQAETFVEGLKELVVEVNNSDFAADVKERLGVAADKLSSFVAKVNHHLGYVGDSSGPTSEELHVLEQAEERLQDNLVDLRDSLDLIETFETAFGEVEPGEAESVLDEIIDGDGEFEVEIRDAEDLPGQAAFDGEKILLSEDQLRESPDELDRVLLEETEHVIGQRLHNQDQPGDEGALFAERILDGELSETRISELKQEDDQVGLELDGRLVTVEMSDSRQSYEIQSGDTLWDIAERELGDGTRWREIEREDGSDFSKDQARTLQIGQLVFFTPDEQNGTSNSTPPSVSAADDPISTSNDIEYGTYEPPVDQAFLDKVEEISDRVGMPPEYLIAIMGFETGEEYTPDVSNPASSATGLIQFVEKTAKGLGTSTKELASMSALEQLDFVEKHLQPNSGKFETLEDAYMAVFKPAAVGQGPDHVTYSRGTESYAKNAGLDENGDGQITAREATNRVRKYLPSATLFGRDVDPLSINTEADSEPTELSPQQARTEVKQIYRDVLDREADPGGLDYWSNAAINSSLQDVRYGIAQTEEAANAIKQVYQEVLGRPADEGGLNHWTSKLESFSLEEIRLQIAQSDEAREHVESLYTESLGEGSLSDEEFEARALQIAAFSLEETLSYIRQNLVEEKVTESYRAILGKEPEADAFEYWVGALAESSLKDVVYDMAHGEESQDNVKQIYEEVLGRSADEAGFNHWLSKLQSLTLGEIRLQIAQSEEAQGHLESIYTELLGEGDYLNSEEREAWTQVLANTSLKATRQKIQQVLPVAVVLEAYEEVLHREPTAGDLDYWTSTLAKSSLKDVRYAIAHSREAENLVGQAYQDLLGRDSDAAGLKHWVSELATNSLIEVRHRIALSDEARGHITALYAELLGEGDYLKSEEYETWSEQLADSTLEETLADIRKTLPEMKVREAYEDILGRAADEGGLKHWVNVVNQTSLKEARHNIAHREEAIEKVTELYQTIFETDISQQELEEQGYLSQLAQTSLSELEASLSALRFGATEQIEGFDATQLKEDVGRFIGEQGLTYTYSSDEVEALTHQINAGLDSHSTQDFIDLLGAPAPIPYQNYDHASISDIQDEALQNLMVEGEDVGPFSVTGLKPAVEALKRIFARVKADNPDLYASLGTAGMLLIRATRPASGGWGQSFSKHSWGAAIDLRISDTNASFEPQAGLLALAPYFREEGFRWGESFNDAMHFEASEQLIEFWASQGYFDGVSNKTLSLSPNGISSTASPNESLSEAEIIKLQKRLIDLGYDLPEHGADGDVGTETSIALNQFKRDHGLRFFGEFDDGTKAALLNWEHIEEFHDGDLVLGTISSGVSVSSFIGRESNGYPPHNVSTDEIDEYTFSVSHDKNIAIHLGDFSGKVQIELTDKNGNEITSKIGESKTTAEAYGFKESSVSITERLKAGDYHIKILNQGETDYILSVSTEIAVNPRPQEDKLIYGSSGEEVEDLQVNLKLLGYEVDHATSSPYTSSDDVSTRFGAITEKAVKEFQKDVGLPESGRVNEETLSALENEVSKIKETESFSDPEVEDFRIDLIDKGADSIYASNMAETANWMASEFKYISINQAFEILEAAEAQPGDPFVDFPGIDINSLQIQEVLENREYDILAKIGVSKSERDSLVLEGKVALDTYRTVRAGGNINYDLLQELDLTYIPNHKDNWHSIRSSNDVTLVAWQGVDDLRNIDPQKNKTISDSTREFRFYGHGTEEDVAIRDNNSNKAATLYLHNGGDHKSKYFKEINDLGLEEESDVDPYLDWWQSAYESVKEQWGTGRAVEAAAQRWEEQTRIGDDGPWLELSQEETPSSNSDVTEVVDQSSDIKQAQERLLQLGYKLENYGPDGELGDETRSAIKEFQQDRGLQVTGKLDEATVTALDWEQLQEGNYSGNSYQELGTISNDRGFSVKGTLGSERDLSYTPYFEKDSKDQFSFKLVSSQKIKLNISEFEGKAELVLLDENKHLITRNEGSSHDFGSIVKNLKPGKYHVSVVQDSGAAETDYLLNISTEIEPLLSNPISGHLERGSQGEDVKVLQRQLEILDQDVEKTFDDSPYNKTDVSGTYSTLTEQAVKNIQKILGLPIDGEADSKTLEVIGAAGVFAQSLGLSINNSKDIELLKGILDLEYKLAVEGGLGSSATHLRALTAGWQAKAFDITVDQADELLQRRSDLEPGDVLIAIPGFDIRSDEAKQLISQDEEKFWDALSKAALTQSQNNDFMSSAELAESAFESYKSTGKIDSNLLSIEGLNYSEVNTIFDDISFLDGETVTYKSDYDVRWSIIKNRYDVVIAAWPSNDKHAFVLAPSGFTSIHGQSLEQWTSIYRELGSQMRPNPHLKTEVDQAIFRTSKSTFGVPSAAISYLYHGGDPHIAEDIRKNLTTATEPNKISQAGHLILDLAGFIPAFGFVPDLINGAWYAYEGDAKNAAFSLAAAAPLVGDSAALAKLGSQASKAGALGKLGAGADKFQSLINHAEAAQKIGRAGNAAEVADSLYAGVQSAANEDWINAIIAFGFAGLGTTNEIPKLHPTKKPIDSPDELDPPRAPVSPDDEFKTSVSPANDSPRTLSDAEVEGDDSISKQETDSPTGARGPSSDREYDENQIGPPIRDLDPRKATINHRGIDVVESHLKRFTNGKELAPLEDAMIIRLRRIADEGVEPQFEDLAFYTHELRESVRYRNLGVPAGKQPENDTEFWNNVHSASLEDYGVSDKDLFPPRLRKALEFSDESTLTGARGNSEEGSFSNKNADSPQGTRSADEFDEAPRTSSTPESNGRSTHFDEPEIETNIVAKEPIENNQHHLKITSDGRLLRCSSCSEIRAEYSEELATHPQLKTELEEIETIDDLDKKAEAAVGLSERLSSARLHKELNTQLSQVEEEIEQIIASDKYHFQNGNAEDQSAGLTPPTSSVEGARLYSLDGNRFYGRKTDDKITQLNKEIDTAKLAIDGLTDERIKFWRRTTPSKRDSDISNEAFEKYTHKNGDIEDWITGLRINDLDPELDHIYAFNKIIREEGFIRLSEKDQIAVLNNPNNLAPTTEKLNQSKNDSSIEPWLNGNAKQKPNLTFERRQNILAIEKKAMEAIRNDIDKRLGRL